MTPVLEARRLAKRYGHVEALRGADFVARAGEVVALIGDNGAGKSTLVKVLSGSISPDAGELLFEGKPVSFSSPHVAQAHGVGTVYQDLALAPELDPTANVFLGRERKRAGFLGRLGVIDTRRMRQETIEAFQRLSIDVDPSVGAVSELSGGQRQGVAVARAVLWADKVLFLDEPTAALGVVQTQKVLSLVRRVADRGIAVVLISHNMPDVLAVADRISVMRLGRRVAVLDRDEATTERLIGCMTGLEEARVEATS